MSAVPVRRWMPARRAAATVRRKSKLSSVSTQSERRRRQRCADRWRPYRGDQAGYLLEGRFQINADAIADGLINTARDLLQSQRKT